MISTGVAIACCRRSTGAVPSDLYPDPDAPPLQTALGQLGVSSTLVSWDDPSADWSAYSRVVISSTWDGIDRPVEYLTWARTVAAVTRLINPEPLVAWNLDKAHQRQLGEAGVPLVPTAWVAPNQPWEPPAGEFVIKPSVSAGGRGTARYRQGDEAAALGHLRSLHRAGQTVMVQPYMSSIDRTGEIDLVFFDGQFSHAVGKIAALRPGEGPVDRPWERMAWSGQVTPGPDQMSVGEMVMTTMAQLIGDVPAYARVDLVSDSDGKPVLLELELIDPYLSLDMVPQSAARLAASVMRR